MKVSVYKNVTHPNVKANVTVNHLLNYIKINPHAQEARKSKNLSLSKKIIPVVTWAGCFEPSRKLANIKELSGLMYCDIDTKKHSKKDIFSIPEVVAVWESISKKGYGFLVAVDDLNKENYSSTWSAFAEYSSLDVDISTKDVTRCNILSFDPEIMIKKTYNKFDSVYPEIIVKKSYVGDLAMEDDQACYLCYLSAKKKHEYSPGSRSSFCFIYFSLTNEYGVDMSNALHFMNMQGCYSYKDFNLDKFAKELYERKRNKYNTKIKDNGVRNKYWNSFGN